jgi:hypothetical protein
LHHQIQGATTPTIAQQPLDFGKKHPFSYWSISSKNLQIHTHWEERWGHFCSCSLWYTTHLSSVKCKQRRSYFSFENKVR